MKWSMNCESQSFQLYKALNAPAVFVNIQCVFSLLGSAVLTVSKIYLLENGESSDQKMLMITLFVYFSHFSP